MAIGFQLDLRQSQQLVMTPQLQQAIRLLQMSNLELRAFVEQEAEKNPLISLADGSDGVDGALDSAPDARGENLGETPLDARVTGEGDHSLGTDTFDTGTENLYDIGPGDLPGNSLGGAARITGPGGSHSFDDTGYDIDQAPDRPANLRAHLLGQLGQIRTEPRLLAIARLLVEELDEHGYLRTDLALLAARLGAAPGQVEAALDILHGCEPTGVGARCLAECLALQLAERDRLDPAMRTLVENIALLERGERRRLQALCGVDTEDFTDMLAELRALDPRPCAGFETRRAETLIPDILMRRAPGGGWEIELNSETMPRVLADTRYAARLAKSPNGSSPETRRFLAEARANAGWLVRSLDQRARSILAVATEIVRRQDAFFAEGIGGLRPLTMAMVAESTGLHESTVSRVTANKYLATERGILELKFFFTNAVGADGVTSASVRHLIRRMVDAESPDAILSDDEIVQRLQDDGIEVARRTVAKYRKVLGVPSSVERRRMKALVQQP